MIHIGNMKEAYKTKGPMTLCPYPICAYIVKESHGLFPFYGFEHNIVQKVKKRKHV